MLVCRKCGSARLGLRQNAKNPAATDLFCLSCGAWQKFANTDERRLYPVFADDPRFQKPEPTDQRSYWQWFEEWTESTPDGPAECTDAGWRCHKCGFSLNEISYCFDDPNEPPRIKYCPECGRPMILTGGSR